MNNPLSRCGKIKLISHKGQSTARLHFYSPGLNSLENNGFSAFTDGTGQSLHAILTDWANRPIFEG